MLTSVFYGLRGCCIGVVVWDLARDDHNIYVPDHDIHMNWEAGVMREGEYD